MPPKVQAPPPRWLEYMLLGDLPDAPRNPKGHDEPGLSASLARFGYLEPVVLDERTGKLVGGHGRRDTVRRALDAGDPPPEGVIASPEGWRLPVTRGWASKNDAEAEAATLALNRLVEKGGIAHPDMLADMLDSLVGQLDGTGYTADDLDDLLASLGPAHMPEQETDAHHATQTPRGEPQVPREVQGLREVGLMFTQADHAEYLESLVRLKRGWSVEAAPVVVLRALREAVGRLP